MGNWDLVIKKTEQQGFRNETEAQEREGAMGLFCSHSVVDQDKQIARSLGVRPENLLIR